jgi:hypothetical protein
VALQDQDSSTAGIFRWVIGSDDQTSIMGNLGQKGLKPGLAMRIEMAMGFVEEQ